MTAGLGRSLGDNIEKDLGKIECKIIHVIELTQDTMLHIVVP
jgi:hypothetical protein